MFDNSRAAQLSSVCTLGEAIRFVEKKRDDYPFDELVGAIYPLRKIDAAFERAQQGDLVRVAVDPQKE